MYNIGAITFQINTTIKAVFPDKTTDDHHVHSDKTHIVINNENQIKQDIEKHIENIKNKFENQQWKKSGGSIKSIGKIRLMISQYKPLKGSSHFHYQINSKILYHVSMLKMRTSYALNIVFSLLYMILVISHILKG